MDDDIRRAGTAAPPGRPRVAVVGHVEWTTIAGLDQLPTAGDVIHAEPLWQGPAGAGAVAAVRLAELAGRCAFFTALGDDRAGRRSRAELEHRGVRVLAAVRTEPTREAVSLVDRSGERTTITLGARLQPVVADPLDWGELAAFDAVFFTAGDAALLRRARRAGVLVVTAREFGTVLESGVRVDALVGSGCDPAERCDPALLRTPPDLVVSTEGGRGGVFSRCGRPPQRYRAARAPGPLVDTYGVGDNFAAVLTYALATGATAADALALAARHGAACTARRGPFAAEPAPHRRVAPV
ncbi:PfkB family carbohydrate kinase [Kitasatospora sp. RB6PN24]|uniref:PfkB family carbohydrate kinase n=1 Tax=Kitasatospora humi TaxID=2893891 RepID=UPI001E55FC80|nr:PfkB family carbohydrate kinase [Kitasatospora humi]MCC9305891.1 PfkB family carbohydrate kinase [Kitasatospora humi]